MVMNRAVLEKIIQEEVQALAERCWDGYERVPNKRAGEQGSCREKGSVNEAEMDLESKIRKVLKDEGGAAGMEALVKGTEATEKDIKSAIKGMSDVGVHKDGDYIADDGDNIDVVEEGEICDAGLQYVFRTDPGGKDIKRGDEDKDGDGENWVHSDGTPCGGGDKDGSKSRCKPASKWKTMSKKEKKADDAKKAKGTKAGKQYVPATKKGKVTKSHTKREGVNRERLMEIVVEELDRSEYHEEIDALSENEEYCPHCADQMEEAKKKKPCKPSKGKRFAKRVDGKCRSYGQAGQAKSGGDRIRPGTKKGDAYCARSAGIKKCKNPPCANTLSRKKWKCRGKKSMK